jgi:hypothetical protein
MCSRNFCIGGTPGAGKVLTSDANGVASWQTSSGGGGTGNLDGSGIAGYLSKWTTATSLAISTLYESVSKIGINTTSPTATLFVQASSTSNSDVFTAASSSGSSLFTVGPNGSTTISSLIAGPVRSTSAGQLYNGLISATSEIAGILPISNGGTGIYNVPGDDQILVGNGTAYQLQTLPSCNASTEKIIYSTSTNSFACGTDAGAGGGITSLNGLTAAGQTFSASSDSNLQLTITSSGSVHTFTSAWSVTILISG